VNPPRVPLKAHAVRWLRTMKLKTAHLFIPLLLAGCLGPHPTHTSVWVLERCIPAQHEITGNVAVSPNGRFVAAACADGVARLWDIRTGRVEHEFKAEKEGYLSSVEFSPDGRMLLTSAATGVRLWNIRTRDLLFVLDGWSGRFSSNGNAVYTDGFIVTGMLLWGAPAPHKYFSTTTGEEVDWPDEFYIYLWDECHEYPINGDYVPGARYALTQSYTNNAAFVRLWDQHRKKLLQTVRLPDLWSDATDLVARLSADA